GADIRPTDHRTARLLRGMGTGLGKLVAPRTRRRRVRLQLPVLHASSRILVQLLPRPRRSLLPRTLRTTRVRLLRVWALRMVSQDARDRSQAVHDPRPSPDERSV